MSIKLVKQNNFDQAIAQLMNGKFTQIDFKPETDTPDTYPLNSMTFFNTGEKTYNGKTYCGVLTIVGRTYSGGGILQLLIKHDVMPIYYRCSIGAGTSWMPWDYFVSGTEMNVLVEKVAILATPKAGITIDNKSYRINKVAYISLSASKTDGTPFSNTANIGNILTMSLQTPVYSNVLSVLCLSEGGTPYGIDTACYSNDGSLYIGKPAINAKHVRVTGTLLLN